MSPVDRNSADRDRVPPGQDLASDFPVLQAGQVEHLSADTWTLNIFGLVDHLCTFDWRTLLLFPSVEQTCDIHCVTGWSKLDTRWTGVRVTELLKGVNIKPQARHVVAHAPSGWTTNLPLEELLKDDVIVAYEYERRPTSAEHGGPVRLIVPRLYLWKSAKWLTGIEFTADERLGFWELRGYHRLGDPWLEQRYS